MITIISISVILIISFIMALRSVSHEMDVPKEIRNLRITKRKGIGGVILFLRDKIVHYSSSS